MGEFRHYKAEGGKNETTSQSPPPSPPGLVAGYAFDEGSGTTATDTSGNNNSGTLTNGPAWSTGQYGGALSFDGTNDYVNVPDAASLDLTSWTISAWVFSYFLSFFS